MLILVCEETEAYMQKLNVLSPFMNIRVRSLGGYDLGKISAAPLFKSKMIESNFPSWLTLEDPHRLRGSLTAELFLATNPSPLGFKLRFYQLKPSRLFVSICNRSTRSTITNTATT